MQTFEKLSMDALCERLCQNKMTLIVYHVRSDADAVGSAFALRELLKLMGINVMCVCADEVPQRLKFLSDDAQGSVVVDEDIEGQIQSITIENILPLTDVGLPEHSNTVGTVAEIPITYK